MSSICFICSEPYTTNGTEHALYSTKCGHLMGKSCLEEWIHRTSNQGRFNCPTCRELLLDGDCHPIYGLPKKLLKSEYDDYKDKYLCEDDIMKECLSGRLKKESTFFLETGNKRFSKMFIQFFDVHNEYILIAGHFSYEKTFLQVHKGNDIFYDKLFSYTNFITAAFNKFYEDAVKFCVGFPDGLIEHILLSITNGVCSVPYESLLINEDGQINSICFLEKKKVVYSVGECNIFSLRTDKVVVKENWLGNVNVKLKAVTNLTVKSDSVLLGIMDGKIYIFEKNKVPYIVYSEENVEVINYTFDPVVDMISIVNSLEYQGGGDIYDPDFDMILIFNSLEFGGGEDIYGKNVLNTIRGISKIFMYDNKGCKRKVYNSYTFQNFPNITYQSSQEFKPILISAKNHHKYFTYSFIPNEENGMLQVHFVNDAFNVVGKTKIENLDKCIGIFALKKPNVLSSKVVKIPIVLMFREGFTMLNCYTLI